MASLAVQLLASPAGWAARRGPARPAAAANRIQAAPRRSSRAQQQQRRQRAPARAAAGSGSGAPPVALTLPDGTNVAMPQAALVVGSGADADLQLQGAKVAAAHARLEWKSGRLFCTALSADPDELLAPTHCWLDGVELRPGASYMVAPGAKLAVGSQDRAITFSFEEGGSSGLAEMLLKGFAASASKEVQEKLDL